MTERNPIPACLSHLEQMRPPLIPLTRGRAHQILQMLFREEITAGRAVECMLSWARGEPFDLPGERIRTEL